MQKLRLSRRHNRDNCMIGEEVEGALTPRSGLR